MNQNSLKEVSSNEVHDTQKMFCISQALSGTQKSEGAYYLFDVYQSRICCCVYAIKWFVHQ